VHASLHRPSHPGPAAGADWPGRAAWAASFLGFPLGGLAAIGVVGPVDAPSAALVGGALTGAVVGAAQALATRVVRDRRRRLPLPAWTAATAAGLAAGLALGTSTVGFATSLGALALQGALVGAVVGPLQALALPAGARRWPWAVAAPALFATGWTVTTLAGVGVDAQFTVFGATGALTYTALAGLLLRAVLPRTTRS
jgi:hypothetical protein